MGLDMYLHAVIDAPKGSVLADIVEKHLDDLSDYGGGSIAAELDHFYEDGSGGEAYLSGWDWAPRGDYVGHKPQPIYVDLVNAMGLSPDEGSPHMNLRRDGDGGYVIEPCIIYWRKANAIHRWFVDECQDGVDECQDTEIHPESLMALLNLCEQVTAARKPNERAGAQVARALLPSQSGFFFGSTDYDEWYYRDVEETARKIRTQVAAAPKGCGFVYRSSW